MCEKYRSIYCGCVSESDIGSVVRIAGWVENIRDHGGVIFVDLRDRSGILQIVFNRDFLKDDFKLAESLKNEYCIKVYGKLTARGEGLTNANIATGDVELIVERVASPLFSFGYLIATST